MNPIQSFLNEVEQTITNGNIIDQKFGCDKIVDYHRKRLCRMDGRIQLLKNRYKKCRTDKCRKIIQSQLKKWNDKKTKEMYQKKEYEKTETYS